MEGIAGKVAVVSGAAGGIGAVVVSSLAAEGAAVAAIDVDEKRIADTIEEVRRRGSNAFAHCVDVTDSVAVGDTVGRITRELGPVDILVNVAGVLRIGPVADLSDEDWAISFAVNSSGVFNLSRAVIHGMAERRSGCIVTVASNAASVPRMHMAAYAASKAASVMFTKCLGLELARFNVRCNVVCPGSTDTSMLHALWKDASGREETLGGSLEKYRVGIPLGRIGLAEDVANAVIFLASDKARQITMQDLYVDGGAALR